MKRNLLPLLALCLSGSAFSQIQNGGFEDWDKLILFEQPVMDFDAISSNYEIFLETDMTNVTKVFHNDGAAVRLENVETEDGVAPAFYLLGEIPTQNGEEMVFPGGLAASDANVSGISVAMNYDIPIESPGFVIVQYKLNGVPVGSGNMGTGTFHFPISGQQEWETMEFDFGGPIAVEFDQVVVGFATSDLIENDSDFPVEAWMEIDDLSFINSTDEVPNGSFDIWAQVPPIFVPAKMDVEVDLLNPNFVRSIQSFEGQYTLGVITQDLDGFIEPAKVMMGTSDVEGTIPTIEMGEGSMLSFAYRYMTDQDIAAAIITFYQEDGESLVPVYGKVINLEATEVFETVEYNFMEDLEANFLSASKMSLEFVSSKDEETAEANSTLYLDNVEISGALNTRIPVKQTSLRTVSAYPNPTLGRTIFTFNDEWSGHYRVFNSQGFQIDVVQFENKKSLIHSLLEYPDGQYTFKFYHEEGVASIHVIKI